MNQELKKEDLQDIFLSALKREQSLIFVYLMNGIKLKGYIYDYNQEVVILKNGACQLIYKHSISTIMPLGSAYDNDFGIKSNRVSNSFPFNLGKGGSKYSEDDDKNNY